MRIAVDTNCLIGALVNPRGACARIVRAWLDGRVEAVASEATVREAELVLGGRWLARMVGWENVDGLLNQLRTRTVWVAELAHIADLSLKDEGDLRMVETAVAGGAQYVVTTDREFLSRRGYSAVEFVTPQEFLRQLEDDQERSQADMTTRTREEIANSIRADQAFWRALVAEVGRNRMDEPGPMGDWTFKDLVSHLAGWRKQRIASLEAGARGEAEPPTPWPAEFDDDDSINDWLRERDRTRSLDDLLADYDGSFERFAVAVEALPESVLQDPNAFRWTDGEPLIEGDPTSHLHDGHVPAIRAWLDRRREPAG